jgi:hypothetical protein
MLMMLVGGCGHEDWPDQGSTYSREIVAADPIRRTEEETLT